MDESQTNSSIEIRNKSLYKCLKKYVQEIFPILYGQLPDLRAPNKMGYRWRKRTGGNQEYDLVEIRFPEVRFAYELQFLPSAEDCIKAMHSDPVIKARLENKINFVNMGRGSDPHGMIWSFSEKISHKKQKYIFDEQIFDECYRDFENDFYLDFFCPRTVLPIRCGPPRFQDQLFFAELPIILTDDLRIDYLTEDDVSLCIEYGFNFGERIGTSFLFAPRFGIFYQPRIKIPNRSTNSFQLEYPPPPENIFDVMNALIVFRTCNLNSHGYFTACDHTVFHSGRCNIGTLSYGRNHPPLSLDSPGIESFKDFFKKFVSHEIKDCQHIQVAISRFCFAASRASWEEKIVDLLISSEALFIKDGKEELRFRTALGTAKFLGENPENQEEIFNDMKKAYDLRSNIVHGWKGSKGASTREKFVKRYKENYQANLNLSNKIEEYIRKSLFKIITQNYSTDDKNASLDWEAKLFQS